MKKLTMTLMVGAATLALSTGAMAQQTSTQAEIQPSAGDMQTTVDTKINQLKDDSMVVITGMVAEIDGDEFMLNYGGNQMLTVELDRFGFDGEETQYLTVGESVTVSGYIDDDLFEGREIEARDVRLNDSYVYYYYDTPNLSQNYGSYNNSTTVTADMNDSETEMQSTQNMEDGTYFSMTGSVTAIDGMMATVEGNNQTISVDMSELGYDPTDDEGLQKIEIGDRVFVYGEIDDGFFTDKQLMASGAVELQQRGNNASATTQPTATTPASNNAM